MEKDDIISFIKWELLRTKNDLVCKLKDLEKKGRTFYIKKRIVKLVKAIGLLEGIEIINKTYFEK